MKETIMNITFYLIMQILCLVLFLTNTLSYGEEINNDGYLERYLVNKDYNMAVKLILTKPETLSYVDVKAFSLGNVLFALSKEDWNIVLQLYSFAIFRNTMLLDSKLIDSFFECSVQENKTFVWVMYFRRNQHFESYVDRLKIALQKDIAALEKNPNLIQFKEPVYYTRRVTKDNFIHLLAEIEKEKLSSTLGLTKENLSRIQKIAERLK